MCTIQKNIKKFVRLPINISDISSDTYCDTEEI